MVERTYRASLSKSQEREGWSMIFRHPVRADDRGRPGRRVRRGLATRDESEALSLVAQMNEILADRTLWEPAARPLAEERFDPRVVEIFYHKLLPAETDAWAIRDEAIPLPGSETGYRRVLLLGTTGAGKTTLVRQLLGTDPRTEKFPSTSTARTTIADTEVVLTDEPEYRAVVTFTPADEVREYLQECMSAAVLAAYRGASDREVNRRLLQHVDQRFRFNHVLGNTPGLDPDDDVEDEEPEETAFDDDAPQAEELGDIDLAGTCAVVARVVEGLRSVAQRLGARVRGELDPRDEADERVLDEIFEDELDNLLREDETFHELGDALMDEIERRFDLLEEGDLRRSRQGWPLSWSWQTGDRRVFVKAVLRFSSNHARYFGRLLTPIVNGIRVSGPFEPSWLGRRPKLVLLDGEGLGHTPDSASSLPTTLMTHFDTVDAVVLVDNAQQPMLAAPGSAMRALVSSGNAGKLLFCFTHVDAVVGDNLLSPRAKEEHVLASAENVLRALGEDLGPFAERALRRRLESACFFVGGIQRTVDPAKQRRTTMQLCSLVESVEHVAERPDLPVAVPVYDRMNLALAVRSAAENFHASWRARLGLPSSAAVRKEHWTRVKALTRRLAFMGKEGYDTLLPVADLERQLRERLFVVVQNPREWKGPEPTDEECEQIFEDLAASVTQKVRALAERRIWVEQTSQWQVAYGQQGTGSTFVRASLIAEAIYDKAAPIPDLTPSPDRNRFLHEVVDLVEEAAREFGAELV